MPTPEEKAAKQKLASAKAKVRTMMIASRFEDAEAYAKSQGFELFDARLPLEYQSPAEPFFAELEAKRKPAAQPEQVAGVDLGDEAAPAEVVAPTEPEAPAEINGWPVLTDAVVWGIPPNRALVVIELPDRRRVSMWRTRRMDYRIYMKIKARIVKTEGDPIYEEVLERGGF